MSRTLEELALTAAAAHDIAMDIHLIKVFKQTKKVMRDIHHRAKHGYFNIKCVNIDKEVGQYLTSMGYNVKAYIDMDSNHITVIQWNEEEDNAKNT